MPNFNSFGRVVWSGPGGGGFEIPLPSYNWKMSVELLELLELLELSIHSVFRRENLVQRAWLSEELTVVEIAGEELLHLNIPDDCTYNRK